MRSSFKTFIIHKIVSKKAHEEKKAKVYLSNEIKAKVAFNVTSEISRKVPEDSFLINSPSSNPSELVITSHILLQVMRELPVMHPSFCICPSYSPFF